MIITGFNHVSFTVSNLDISLKYYQDILGMKTISYSKRPSEYVESVTKINRSMKVAYVNGFGLVLELIEYVGSEKGGTKSKTDNIGCGHICFDVGDMDKIIHKLKNKGIEFIGDPVRIPAGTNKNGQVVYALDPDGIVTEFIQRA